MKTRSTSAIAPALAFAIAFLHPDIGSARQPPGIVKMPVPAAGPLAASGKGASGKSLLGRRGPKPARSYQIGDRAVDFTFLDQYGNPVTLSKLKDQNVILDFCATWCGPCRQMASGAQHVVRDLQAAGIPITYIVVLFENENFSAATQTDAARWSAHFDNPWPVVHPGGDDDQANRMVDMLLAYGGGSIPTLVLLGPDNVIEDIRVGVQTVTQLQTAYAPGMSDPFPGGEPGPVGGGACGTVDYKVGFTAYLLDFMGYAPDGGPIYDWHGATQTFPYPTDPASLPPWILSAGFETTSDAFAGTCESFGTFQLFDDTIWPPPLIIGLIKEDEPITVSLATDAPGAVGDEMQTWLVQPGPVVVEPVHLPYSPAPSGGMTVGPFTLNPDVPELTSHPYAMSNTLSIQLVPLSPVVRLNNMIDTLVADEGARSDVDLVLRLRHALSSLAPPYSTADPEISTSRACDSLDSFVTKLIGEADSRVSAIATERLSRRAAKAAESLGCDTP